MARFLASGRKTGLAKLCEFDVLGLKEERRLFRCLDQARRQAERLEKSRAGRTRPRQTERTAAQVAVIRNRIAQSNLRLVVSLAARFASPQQSLEDLVSEASIPLLRCVERFDSRRGTRFSTYATRALTHHFLRLRRREQRRRVLPLTDESRNRVSAFARDCEPLERLIRREEMQRLRKKLLELRRRDFAFLGGRFGLNGESGSQTFRELGRRHGVSKEWARVRTAVAIERLRELLADETDS